MTVRQNIAFGLKMRKAPKAERETKVDEVTQIPEIRHRIEEELADILVLCFSLANRLEIDVADAMSAKLTANESKYPADLVRGRAHKYTYYDRES